MEQQGTIHSASKTDGLNALGKEIPRESEDMAKGIVSDAVKGSYLFSTQCNIDIRYSLGVPRIEEIVDPTVNGTLSILCSATT